MLSSSREELERTYHQCRDRLGLELHRFVRADEEEKVKFRRRMHIHLCLLGCSGALSFLSVLSLLSVTVVTGISVSILSAQELLDYIGRF